MVIGNFVHHLKSKLFQKDPIKYSHFNIPEQKNKYHYWKNLLLAEDQQKEFPELFIFFQLKQNEIRTIPSLISKLNIILDPQTNLLVVK